MALMKLEVIVQQVDAMEKEFCDKNIIGKKVFVTKGKCVEISL